jgi:FkbM family methyltransferase
MPLHLVSRRFLLPTSCLRVSNKTSPPVPSWFRYVVHNFNLFQDELIYDMFFKHPIHYNGTFIEVGATDGIRGSNTLFFEEALGWNGLLVEGSTENFHHLKADRRRKGSTKVFSAVCSEKGVSKYIGDGLAAGAIEDMTLHHIESWAKHFKSLQIYEVPCDKMSALVRQAGMPRTIDLMSVDIEGGEYRALATFDWSAHDVRVIVIEPGITCYQRHRNLCAELLKGQGFCLVARRAVNEYWVSDPIFRQTYCL